MSTFIFLLVALVILVFLFREKIQQQFFPEKDKNLTIDDVYNSEKREREKEIDQLLSKIGKNGMKDLSEKDKKRLDELSKK